VLKHSEERDFVKVPRWARPIICDLRNVYYVRCRIIEQYPALENIELCTMFCNDELREEEISGDESADHTNSTAYATLRGHIIVTSHVRSVIDDSKLLLDIKKMYDTYFFQGAVQLLATQTRMATPEHLPCNQLYLLRKARELQSML